MRIELSGYTDIGTRAENQDSYAYKQTGEDSFYAIVADGLGGHRGGKEASEIAVKYLIDAADKEQLPTADRINKRLNAANSEIIHKRKNANQMKSTVVALYMKGREVIWVHIGDSRLYHFYNGELAHFTRDHSVPQISVQLGDITRDDILGHPDRSKLLRVLGDEELRPEVTGPICLDPGQHAFLLCSDGFWEYMHDDEIFLDINKCTLSQRWLQNLRWRRYKRLNAELDNNTAIAVMVDVPAADIKRD